MFRSVILVTCASVGISALVDAQQLIVTCTDKIRDQADSLACLQASSEPMEGLLYPLSEHLFVSSQGDVGIGTTSPAAQLHVSGGAMVLDNTYWLSWKNANGSVNGGLRRYQDDMILTGKDIYFHVNDTVNPAPALKIDSLGNVGIGTVNPAAKLHVSGGAFVDNGSILLDNSQSIYWPSSTGPHVGGITRWADNTMFLAANMFQFRVNDEATLKDALTITAAGDLIVSDNGTPPIYRNIHCNQVFQYSSKRWKENIETVDDALALVKKLRGVYYNRVGETRRELGMIAEEVGEVLPELVALEEDGKSVIGMDYGRITALLVEALKAQQAEIEDLRVQNVEQGKRITDQEERLTAQDERLEELASEFQALREQFALATHGK